MNETFDRLRRLINMTAKKRTEIIREGDYLAEVDVELTDAEQPWGPYLSLDEARKLDAARLALRRGDLRAAGALGRVYRLSPVTAAV